MDCSRTQVCLELKQFQFIFTETTESAFSLGICATKEPSAHTESLAGLTDTCLSDFILTDSVVFSAVHPHTHKMILFKMNSKCKKNNNKTEQNLQRNKQKIIWTKNNK